MRDDIKSLLCIGNSIVIGAKRVSLRKIKKKRVFLAESCNLFHLYCLRFKKVSATCSMYDGALICEYVCVSACVCVCVSACKCVCQTLTSAAVRAILCMERARIRPNLCNKVGRLTIFFSEKLVKEQNGLIIWFEFQWNHLVKGLGNA